MDQAYSILNRQISDIFETCMQVYRFLPEPLTFIPVTNIIVNLKLCRFLGGIFLNLKRQNLSLYIYVNIC